MEQTGSTGSRIRVICLQTRRSKNANWHLVASETSRPSQLWLRAHLVSNAYVLTLVFPDTSLTPRVLVDGVVLVFGWNIDGQLGTGRPGVERMAQVLTALKDKKVVQVQCGSNSSFCITGTWLSHATMKSSSYLTMDSS